MNDNYYDYYVDQDPAVPNAYDIGVGGPVVGASIQHRRPSAPMTSQYTNGSTGYSTGAAVGSSGSGMGIGAAGIVFLVLIALLLVLAFMNKDALMLMMA
jgi:hypothetical protein